MIESNFLVEKNRFETKNELVSHSSFECDEVELVDVIDEVEINSFLSYESLKEYACSNGLFDYQSFSVLRTSEKNTLTENSKNFNDEDSKLSSPRNETKTEKEFKYNTRSKILNQKSSGLNEKTNNKKDEFNSHLNDDNISTNSKKQNQKNEKIEFSVEKSLDSDPFDCFLKRLDEILVEKKSETNADHIFISKSSNYDHEMMIWPSKIDIQYENSKKFNRSISSCSFSSNSTTRSTIKSANEVNKCGKDHCRLGCICESLSNLSFINNTNSAKKTSISNMSQFNKTSANVKNSSVYGGSVIFRDHCGRIECMFECSCFRRLRSATRSSRHDNDVKGSKRRNNDIKSDSTTKNGSKSNRNKLSNRKQQHTEKNRPSSNESNRNLSDGSSRSTSSFSSSTSSSNTSDEEDQQKQNPNDVKLRKSKRVRKRKKHDSRSEKSDSKIDYNSNSKFNDCYYYYYYNEKEYLKPKNKVPKSINNTAEKVKPNESKNGKNSNAKSDNYEKIVEKFKNSKSTFLNKEIWSLIKLNTNINYDKNNSRRKLVRKSETDSNESSDSNLNECEDFDYKISINTSGHENNYDVKCVEFKKYLNKIKNKPSFEPLEHNVLLIIKSIENDRSQKIYLKSNLRISTQKIVNNLNLLDSLLILIAKLMKKFSFEDSNSWRELEFDYDNDFIVCLMRDWSDSNNQYKKLNVNIESNQRNSYDLKKEIRENLSKHGKNVYDQILEILNNDHINYNSKNIKSSNKKASNIINLKLNDTINHPIKMIDLKVKLKRLNSNWKENLQKKSKRSSNNSTKYSGSSSQPLKNVSHSELATQNKFLDLHKPKILPRVLKNRQKIIELANKCKISQIKGSPTSSNVTRVNLKKIDSLFESVKRSQSNLIKSNKNLEKLLSFCCKTEFKLNSNNSNIKCDNYSFISSNICKFRPYQINNDDLTSLNFVNKNKCYYADEIAYFNKNLFNKNVQKIHNYPFYDPFKDKKLILGMYNQCSSRELVDEVCHTVNDMISVVSLYSSTEQNTNNFEPQKKIIPFNSTSNSKYIVEPNILLINKKTNQNGNTLPISNTKMTPIIAQQNLNINHNDISNPSRTVIKLVSPKCLEQSDQTEVQNDLNKPIVVRGLNTPRILIRPKIFEIRNNQNSTITKIACNSKTSFVPIRPKIVDNEKESKLNQIIRNITINSDIKLSNELNKTNSQLIDEPNISDNFKKCDHKNKRKQELKPTKICSNNVDIKAENVDYDSDAFVEAKKMKHLKKEPDLNSKNSPQHLLISTTSLFKPRIISDNAKCSTKLTIDENDSNNSNSKRKNSFSSASISSYSNKNSCEFFDENYFNYEEDDEEEDFINNSDEYNSGNSFHSLERTNEYSDNDNFDDDNYDNHSSNSNLFTQSELKSKLKRPISNTIHSIKERQRRLSLKRLFNKLKAEMSLAMNELIIVNQSQLELKESLAKNSPKSKQKILKEAVDIIEILECNSNYLENELNQETNKNMTLKKCLSNMMTS